MNIFKKLVTKKISSLESDKIYVVEVPNLSEISPIERTGLVEWSEYLKEFYNIDIVFISENMKFVELPEGYTIRKN